MAAAAGEPPNGSMPPSIEAMSGSEGTTGVEAGAAPKGLLLVPLPPSLLLTGLPLVLLLPSVFNRLCVEGGGGCVTHHAKAGLGLWVTPIRPTCRNTRHASASRPTS